MTKTNPPQYSLEAEQALLGVMLIEPQVYRKARLTVDYFYVEAHKIIFQAIGQMHEDGSEVDFVSVSIHLKNAGLLEKAGGRKFLIGLSDEVGRSTNWGAYLKVIKKKYVARKLNVLAMKLQKTSQNGGNDLAEKMGEAIRELTEMTQEINGVRKSLSEQVREWSMATPGDFKTTDMDRDLGLTTVNDKKAARKALERLRDEGVLANCGTKKGCYRLIEKDAARIDYLNADISQTYDMAWPFQLEKLVNIYPKNIIVVAGAANAGKTAFLLNLAKMNMCNFKVRYLSSEMGAEELKLRLSKFEDIPLDKWRVDFRERNSNFADTIHPDDLNLIDYLEVTKDFYEVGDQIKAIFDRLRKGIAVIAMQKKRGEDVGRGGEFTLEKPRLYLAMDSGRNAKGVYESKLRIIKAKNWARPGVNPNGEEFNYKLIGGANFLYYE